MTDRQPGAPGQYILTIDASVAQNILIGLPVPVTLVRDDQPVVEGTPYNKASVLPDSLAARICPTVTDPTPADALYGLSKKKYPATLFAANWVEASGQYTQSILLSEVKGDENESIRCWPVYSGSKATDELIEQECSAVSYAKTGIGTVIFTCLNGIPATDIPIMVEVSR